MTCPHCGSDKTFRSESGNQRLNRLARLLLVSVRCYACQRKFVDHPGIFGRAQSSAVREATSSLIALSV